MFVSELCLRLSVFSPDGKLLARWGTQENGPEKALFLAPHTIALDSRGDIYVGDVSWTHNKIDRGPNVLRKFARKS